MSSFLPFDNGIFSNRPATARRKPSIIDNVGMIRIALVAFENLAGLIRQVIFGFAVIIVDVIKHNQTRRYCSIACYFDCISIRTRAIVPDKNPCQTQQVIDAPISCSAYAGADKPLPGEFNFRCPLILQQSI